jgi:hypothetical protein
VTEYKELQIIKHALLRYIERPEATEKEIAEERELLNEITGRIEFLKQRYSIE